ncbi:hypothetical protein HHX38_16115 [Streptomyces sp. PKU-MA01144]|uniref:2OG-Fe(II)-dependent halogenase WelO5 family protein n=1 Tax=Streptomyces sp. PKU-MA01144 TaxID=2729138 RepID=UPI00147A2AE0|nr:hypothetical protein [Streptomyces sp. PKU-MA01144]NNJ05651.1 hypothetical protein [Streptomyces sp. PKU-MA01144]
MSENIQITGTRADAAFFRIAELSEFDPAAVLDVLQGRVLGIVFRRVIDSDVLTEFTRRFWDSEALERRGEDAPSFYLGTYQWNKTLDAYLDDCAAVAKQVEQYVEADRSPWRWFRDHLAKELADNGASLRVARSGDREACAALMRAWDAEGEFSLAPHEDTSQCADPRQAGFEVQDVLDHEVCAVNMCLENGNGGRLVMWNVRPDLETRQRLGIVHTGSPYPAAALQEHEEIRVDIQAGDVYVFNGGYVHAVDANHGRRTTLSFLAGFKDDQTVVTWT